ncbi:hypothetical protein BS639_23570 [Rouxiella silvae]|uniref:Fumarase D n=1 Tax=Rouxiella silvae TaxID=1646373 RepID=A0ABX3TU68_9GAMM|nr:DUF2767 family protein [Rouxiella silvae]ORJ18759.1 hypothetical protein BS639_23570 [Rouxiella silvae]
MSYEEPNALYAEACKLIGDTAFHFAVMGKETNKSEIADFLKSTLREKKESQQSVEKSLLYAIKLLEESFDNEAKESKSAFEDKACQKK